ncbi:MAG TPA: hypothetical protein VGO50_01700 [Pyrinomonadaceae bacterium]|nr:hypothetical protein [Pyrinomonadaceae bacterium]
MKKRIIVTFFALMIAGLLSVPAAAQLFTHSVWTNNNGISIVDASNGCENTILEKFDMATSWTEYTPGYPAQAHFRGVSHAEGFVHGCGPHYYEFSLNNSVGTDPDTIKGYWDVYRDGVLKCSSCAGNAYGVGGPVGNNYKLIIDDPFSATDWAYIGYIDQRKDF